MSVKRLPGRRTMLPALAAGHSSAVPCLARLQRCKGTQRARSNFATPAPAPGLTLAQQAAGQHISTCMSAPCVHAPQPLQWRLDISGGGERTRQRGEQRGQRRSVGDVLNRLEVVLQVRVSILGAR